MFDINEVIITTSRDTSDMDLSISAWNGSTGEKLNKYRGGGPCIRHGLVANGGYLIAADDRKPLVHFWLMNGNHCGSSGQLLTSKARCIDVSGDFHYMAVGAEDSVQLYQMGTGQIVANVGKKFQPATSVKFNSDSSLLACAAADGTIIIWNKGLMLAHHDLSEPLFVFEGHRLPVNDMVFTSGGLRSRLVSVSTDRTCKVHDLVSGTLVSSVIYNIGLTAVTLHGNEHHLFIGNKIGGIHVLRLDLSRVPDERHLTVEEQTHLFSGHSDEITSLCCSLHRPLMASGSIDGTARVWDIQTFNCLRIIEHRGAVMNAFFCLLPGNAFSKNFKPPVVLPLNCVQYTTASDNKIDEVITSHDLCKSSMTNEAQESNGTAETDREEYDKLKSINEALYQFSVKRILKKSVLFGTQNKNEHEIVRVNKNPSKAKKRKQNKKTESQA